jgi:uncharacterized protein (TIGR02145 family)
MIICRSIERIGKAITGPNLHIGLSLETGNLVKIPIIRACRGYYIRWYYSGWHYWFFLPGSQEHITEGENYRTLGTRKIQMSTGQITRENSIAIQTILFSREVAILTEVGWRSIKVDPGSIQLYESETEGTEIEITTTIGSREISRTTGFTPVPIIPVVPPSTEYCEIVIGSQIWMCKNWDSNYPGSKVFDDDEANSELYGRLYSWDQIQQSDFAPEGWRVPTKADWDELIAFVGGIAVAGGELKALGTDYWNAPNTDAADAYSFGARGGGAHGLGAGFFNLKQMGYFWTKGEYNSRPVYIAKNDSAALTLLTVSAPSDLSVQPFFSIRLIKGTAPTPFDDWFLPSRNELKAMVDQLYLHSVGTWTEWYYSSSSEDTTMFATPDIRFVTVYTPLNTYISIDKNTSNINIKPCRSFVLSSSTSYSLRDVGPAGGHIFHIEDIGGGQYRYYEAYAETFDVGLAWSNIIALEVGTDYDIGTGQANTAAIIAQIGHSNSHAKLCHDLITYP